MAAWLGFTDSSAGLSSSGDEPVYAPAQTWVTGQPVEMGSSSSDTESGLLVEEAASEYGEEPASDDDEDDTSLVQQSVSSLASYVWHKDLEWDVDQPGRLIVVGDVHGMVDELK